MTHRILCMTCGKVFEMDDGDGRISHQRDGSLLVECKHCHSMIYLEGEKKEKKEKKSAKAVH